MYILVIIIYLKRYVQNSFRTLMHSQPIENIYQSMSTNLTNNGELNSYNYGESDISIASGIYEEIVDDVCSIKSKSNTSNIYEVTDQILHGLQIKPPPLPPRQKQKPEHIMGVRYDWYD